MLLDYYQLREQPFGVTPDARFLYASATHREALASLLYAIESSRGFAALIAQPGMGKTTLLNEALRRLAGRARTAFLFQTIARPAELLAALLVDLGVPADDGESLTGLQSKLNAVLEEQARRGQPVVLFMDEAQNLDPSVLEMVRMLSNFETSQQKLMEIVLAGQPQLAERLNGHELVQLRQRISIIARLKPFSDKETAEYIQHRLRTAGYEAAEPLFTRQASARIAGASLGIPRNINNLCFNALSLGCALQRKQIDEDMVSEVLADLDLDNLAVPAVPATHGARAASEYGSEPASTYGSEASPVAALPAPAVSAWKPGRVSRLAYAGMAAAVLAAGFLLFGMHLGGRRTAAEIATAPVSGPVARPVSAVVPQPGAAVQSVTVAYGETLSGICRRRLGSDSPATLATVRRMNPGLDDPDYVEAGEVIRLPLREDPGNVPAALEAEAAHVSGRGDAR